MTRQEKIIVIITICLDRSWPCICRFCSGTYIPTCSFEGILVACHQQKSIFTRRRLAGNKGTVSYSATKYLVFPMQTQA
jgi:hypothetical protein